MTSLVYHHTDTARLPWILLSGELRPGANRIGDFPDPDFLWATTLAVGDRTASASRVAAQSGLTRLVRFTLKEEDFVSWPAVVEPFPAWTPDHITRLEKAAAGKSSPSTWRCRATPLPSSGWVSIETRSYTNNRWQPFDFGPPPIVMDDDCLGVWVGDTAYFSQQVAHPSGAVGYQAFTGKRSNDKAPLAVFSKWGDR